MIMLAVITDALNAKIRKTCCIFHAISPGDVNKWIFNNFLCMTLCSIGWNVTF